MNKKIFVSSLLILFAAVTQAQEGRVEIFHNSQTFVLVNPEKYEEYKTMVTVAQESLPNSPSKTIKEELEKINNTEKQMTERTNTFANLLNQKLATESCDNLTVNLTRKEESFCNTQFIGFHLIASNFNQFFPRAQITTCYGFDEQNNFDIKDLLAQLPYVTKVFTHQEFARYCKILLDEKENQ